jgi:peptidoglycan lytic transglycosylase
VAVSSVGGKRSSWVQPSAARAGGVLRIFTLVLAAAALAACAQPSVVTTGAQGESHGLASFYRNQTRTASGERASPGELTAAHRTLPFGTRVRITDVDTGRSVTVRVNDRGPFVAGRVVDISHSAAETLGITERGLARVKLDVVQ